MSREGKTSLLLFGVFELGDLEKTMDTVKIKAGKTKLIAHRGLSGIERENTAAAFVAAANRRSYYGIETDVHRTLDGEFVVIHDDNTKRVGIDSLTVEENTFETLRKLRLTDMDNKRGRADLVIPTLEEYILICKRYDKVCILELKNKFKPSDIRRMVKLIDKLDYLNQLVFISFDLSNLKVLRSLLPEQKIQYLLDTWSDKDIEILKEYRMDLDIDYKAATKNIVEKVHGIGREVNVWTVDKKEDAKKMISFGVDYITSNILEAEK